MKFLVDVNSKGLVRWLRFLGFDTDVAEARAPDSRVREIALNEHKILLTRDKVLAESMPKDKAVLLKTDDVLAQLADLIQRFSAPAEQEWFTRCTACNTLLENLSEEELQKNSEIPSFAKERPDSELYGAWRCTTCARIYWKGSHFKRTRAFLHGLCNP